MDYNPYQAPASDIGWPTGDALDLLESGPIRVDGKHLVVKSGVVLPWFCVKTNVSIPERNLQQKRLTWCPSYVVIFFFIVGLLAILAYFVLRKSCKITYGLSADVKQKYRTRLIVKSLVAIALLIAIPLTASINSVPVFPAVFVLFLIAVIALLLGNSPLSVTKHQDGEFWISGCSSEFLSRISA